MLTVVTSALAFNGPSTLLTSAKCAPAVAMSGSLEQAFVYESAAGNARPLGDGKGNGPNSRMPVPGTGTSMPIPSLEQSFVYDSAGGNALPLGDGKGDWPKSPVAALTGKVVSTAPVLEAVEAAQEKVVVDEEAEEEADVEAEVEEAAEVA